MDQYKITFAPALATSEPEKLAPFFISGICINFDFTYCFL
jgi:hypothetical protein